MTFQPLFVPGGVYLRTSTGELLGRLNEVGDPFESLDEAQSHADWLEMAMEFQQAARGTACALEASGGRWHGGQPNGTPST